MIRALQRNVVFLVGLVVTGAICALAAPAMASPRGALGPTVFQAQSPAWAGGAAVICVLFSSVAAGIVSRFFNAAWGWFVLGAGLFVLAGRLEPVSELAFSGVGATSSRVLILVAFETLFWAVLALGGVWIVFKLAGPLSDVQPDDSGNVPHWFRSAAGWRSAAAGLIVLPVVWIMARSPMTGQTIAAVACGSIVAGLIGRLLSPHVQPILLCVAPIAAGAAGHVIGWACLRPALDVAYVQGDLLPLSLPTPIHYAAGALIGIPIGIGWARSFLHHENQPGPTAAES